MNGFTDELSSSLQPLSCTQYLHFVMFPPSKFFTWISFLCSCHFHHSQSDGCRRRGDADKDADLLPVLRNRCRRCFVSNCCGFHWNATWQVESARVAIRWYGFRFPQSLVSFPFQRCRRLIIVSYRSPFVDCLFIFRFASADSTPNIYSPHHEHELWSVAVEGNQIQRHHFTNFSINIR